MADHCAKFRFNGELNGFLAPERRDVAFAHAFDGTVHDRIESLGVPHAQIHMVLVDGEPVCGTHRLQGGECVVVLPRRPRKLHAPRELQQLMAFDVES